MVAVAYVAIVAQRVARLLHHSLRAMRSVGLRPFRIRTRNQMPSRWWASRTMHVNACERMPRCRHDVGHNASIVWQCSKYASSPLRV